MKLRVRGVEDSSYDFTFGMEIKARGMCFNFKVEKAFKLKELMQCKYFVFILSQRIAGARIFFSDKFHWDILHKCFSDIKT